MIQAVYRFPDVVSGDTQNEANFEIKLNSAILDLTGYSIRLNWVTTNGSILKTLSTDNGLIEITDATAGLFRTGAYIANFPATDYVSDMEFTSPSSVVKTYLKVYMRVLKGYTT